jgi:uncharacterized membrane protein
MSIHLAEKALIESRSYRVRALPLLQPLVWLGRGWRDFMRCPLPGLLHGLAVSLFGALLVVAGWHHFWLLIGAFTGFLLIAPLLVTGLYAISRDLERGLSPTLHTALSCWALRDGRLVVFGILLAFAGTGWVLTSALLVTGLVPRHLDTLEDFLRFVVLAPEGLVFESWLALGALLAAPVFASTVVAMPLLLDRPIGVMGAVFTSWKVILEHPAAMAFWAALLMGLTALGMATAMLGLIVIVPWLGHASWHVYRDVVDGSARAGRDG